MVSRLTTATAWGMLMAGASMAVPVTATVTSSNRPPSRRRTSATGAPAAASSTVRVNSSKPGSVKVTAYAPGGNASNT